MTIEDLPKGAIPDPVDERDFKAESIMGAAVVDWSKEFRLPVPTDEDQGQSDACVAYSSSYYHWQLHEKDFSRRDLFARIAQAQGAYIRDGVKAIVDQGQATRDEVPDPANPTYSNMRDKTGVNPQVEASDKELNYFVIANGSIDGVAAAVEMYQGVVFGVTGSNPGWQDLMNPRPPISGETTWGHALYAMGHHMHDGQKCIIAKSSWCNSVKEHHIKENYFKAGKTFNAWTLIPKEQQMNPNVTIYKNGAEYILGQRATTEQGLAQLLVSAGCPDLIAPDGNPDFEKINKIAHVL
jgi:hypothetical protein